MARTLIGQLILRLRAEGLAEANKVKTAMADIERAARRLGSGGVGSWGIGFQRNLDKLKLTRDEIGKVEQSWVALHESIKQRNIGRAMRSAEVSHWKTNTLSALAQGRAEVDKHLAAVERKARGHAARMLKPGFVMLGAYTAPYFAGVAAGQALTAASESTRTKYRMELANIPPEERQAMEGEAQRLSGKYPVISEAEILELNRASFALFGGNGDRARAMMEPIIRSFIADVTAVGVEKAGENLSAFLKAMDNLNVNEGPDGGLGSISGILEGWVKAKQIEGKEIDVGDILGFARRAKIAKYALSDEFLSDYLPALGQDTGFDALGDALAGAYQNFVTPVYTGKQAVYSKRQKAIGLRDENNSLVGRDLFASNPYEWTLQILKPILEKSGVDMTNTAAVSEAVKLLMSNNKASAIISGWINAQTQIEKNIAMYRKAVGTGDVDNAIAKDPFAAWGAVKASLENLSAALTPAEHIASGLKTLADGINKLAVIGKDHPAITGLGMLAGAFGAYKGAKFAFNKMTDMFGLKGSALALDGSAAALTRAAVALGGAGVVDGADVGGKKGAGKGGILSFGGATVASLLALLTLPGDTPGNGYTNAPAEERQRMRDEAREQARAYNERRAVADKPTPAQHTPIAAPARQAEDASMRQLVKVQADGSLDDAFFEGAKQKAAAAGESMKQSMSVTAKPVVDSASIDAAIVKARRLKAELQAAGQAARSANSDLGVEMRRNFSDGAMP